MRAGPRQDPPTRPSPASEEITLDAYRGGSESRERRLPMAISMLVVGTAGLIALLVGLWLLPPQLSLNAPQTANAIFAQLPVTLPAAIAAIIAAAVNIGTAGALLLRVLPGAFRTLPAIVLAAYASAILLDVALLYVLGGLGLFNWPFLVLAHAALIAVAWAMRRPTRRPTRGQFQPHIGWALVGIVWSMPVLLQLASPVVPFHDVLPNLVAPVEHLRTFAQFDPLTTSPSPISGPSRLSLGYVGLLGTIATLTGLPAAQATSAFIVVEVVLVAVAVAALARASAGRHAVFFALVAFAMTQPFARLADDRSRLLAIPIVAWSAIELIRASRHPAARRSAAWEIGVGLGATLVLHAVIGAFMAMALLALVAIRPARYRWVMPGLVMAGILALPQAATMLAIPIPSLAAVLAFPLALAAALAVDRLPHVHTTLVWASRVVVVVAVGAGAVTAGAVLPAFARWLSDFWPAVPLLSVTGVAGLLWVRPAARWVLAAMLGIGAAAGAVANITSSTDNLLWRSVHYEVPKEVHTWLPVVLAVGTAAVLAQLIRRPRAGWAPQGSRLVVVGAWLLVAALPFRSEPINGLHVGERYLAENVAIQLGYAARGYWTGYPDARWLVDDQERQVLIAIRQEIAAGRITATTRLLHLARTYQQWGSIPVGVFTGVIETVVSRDSELTIFTVGGRLVPPTDLAHELASNYDYLLIEPLDLSADARLAGRGYEVIFSNERAILLRRLPAGP